MFKSYIDPTKVTKKSNPFPYLIPKFSVYLTVSGPLPTLIKLRDCDSIY